MRLPKPIQYTDREGGNWIKWGTVTGKRYDVANCIVFDNGRAFDMVSGWRNYREFKYDRKTGNRIPKK